MAITHPTDPRIKGLAAALLESDIPCWEFDQRAVEPGTDPPPVSDWHRRHGRANNRDENIDKAASELIDRVPLRTGRMERSHER